MSNGEHPGAIAVARARLQEAEAAYREAMAPIEALEAQLTELRAEIVEWERKAANIRGPIDAEVQLAARQNRAARITAEIERLTAAARPTELAVEREQARLNQLEQELEVLIQQHRILIDPTHPDVLSAAVGRWLEWLGEKRARVKELLGTDPEPSPYDAAAASHIEQVRRDNEQQHRHMAAAIAARDRPRVKVEA